MEAELFVEHYPSDPDLYIPFSLVTQDGEYYTATCVHDSQDVVVAYLEGHDEDVFDDDNIASLIERLNKIYNPMGYFLPQKGAEMDVLYILDTAPALGNADIVAFKPDFEHLDNKTDIDLHEAVIANQKAYLVLDGDRVLSVACENFTEDNQTEIACETLLEERGKGYAYSTCAALCRDIIERGENVLWRCARENTQSIALAEKLGFKYVGQEVYTCYYQGGE